MQRAHLRADLWRRSLRAGALLAPILVSAIVFRHILRDLAILTLGGAVGAFLIEPIAALFEKKLRRSLSALAALSAVLAALLFAAWFLIPVLIGELKNLFALLPRSFALVRQWVDALNGWLRIHLPGFSLSLPNPEGMGLPLIAESTAAIAGSIADLFYRGSLMIVLSYFFLRDRERILMRLELLVPLSVRPVAVRMGNAVCRQMRLYLRGQGMIAAAVGALSAVGLAVVGVESALLLGLIVGVLNMIPYFGPVIGGIPAVLAALGSGWRTAVMAAAVLWLVQQIDGTIISPRIMSGLTGFSPACVLLAVFVGSGLGGIVGMLFALPLLMTIRTLFRVFVQMHENV